MAELALPERIKWVSYRCAEVRVGKRKQEARYECDIWCKPRVAMHYIPDRDHHRHSDRCQHCAPSHVLSLESGRR